MEKPVVLAMSPRVGLLNHRYFAPSRSGLTEDEAVRWVNIALRRSGPDLSIIHAKTLVPQSSTGRENREVLLVRDPRLSNSPSDVRKEIELILEKRLSDFGQFIEGLPEREKEKASGLLLHHDGFDKLSGAMLRELAPILDALPPVAEGEEPPAPHPVKKTPLSSWIWIGLAAIIIAAVLPVAWSALFGRRAAPGASSEDAAFREFYFAVLGMRRDEKIVSEEFDALAPEQRIDKVRARLMEGYSEKMPKQFESNVPAMPRLTPEEELSPLLVEYYKEKHGSEVIPPPDLLGDQSFRDAMSEVFGQPEVDPTAFLDPKTDGLETLKQFQCTGPRHFHEVVNALAEFQKAVAELESNNREDLIDMSATWQRNFIYGLPKEPELHSVAHPEITLKIYTRKDAETAQEIDNVLRHVSREVNELQSNSEAAEGYFSVLLLRGKLEESRGKWESSNIKLLRKYDVFQKIYDAFQKLKVLGDVWVGAEGNLDPSTSNNSY